MDSHCNAFMDSIMRTNLVPTTPAYNSFNLMDGCTNTATVDMLCEMVNESNFSFMTPTFEDEKTSFLEILYGGKTGATGHDLLDGTELRQCDGAFHNSSHQQAMAAEFANTLQAAGSQEIMSHFKLPFLEQEPENSVNNSSKPEKRPRDNEIQGNLNISNGRATFNDKLPSIIHKNQSSVISSKLKTTDSCSKMKKEISTVKQDKDDGWGSDSDDGFIDAEDFQPAKKARRENSSDDKPKAADASEPTSTKPRKTHITVERNRRKQMNEHLAILRSLMPTSYVQKADQASIIGGVVEFIKELKQLVESLEAQKQRNTVIAEALSPRVSAGGVGASPHGSALVSPRPGVVASHNPVSTTQELVATSRSPLAEVEVKLAGGAQVLLRTRSLKVAHGQLLQLLAALECLSLQILHLNITTHQQIVDYTFTLNIGIECRLSVDDLADAVQQIFKDIHPR